MFELGGLGAGASGSGDRAVTAGEGGGQVGDDVSGFQNIGGMNGHLAGFVTVGIALGID